MGLEVDWIAIDAHDPERLARFWTEVLDYKIEYGILRSKGNSDAG